MTWEILQFTPGKEETGNSESGIQNKIGVAQSEIDLFGIPAKNKLNKSRISLAESQNQLTEKTWCAM